MDTDTRKYSAINISSPWRGVCNIPASALDEPEWFSIVGLYNEFTPVAPVISTSDGASRRNRYRGIRGLLTAVT